MVRVPVAGVPPVPASRVVLVIAEMVGHLTLQGALQHQLGHPAQQPIRADQIHPLSTGLLHQPAGQLLTDPVGRRPGRGLLRRHGRHRLTHCGDSLIRSYTEFLTVPVLRTVPIYLRKDGRYEAAVYVTRPDGTKKRKRVYGKTREEVHEQLVELLRNEQQGIPTPMSSSLLGEYLDYWLEHVVKPDARPATYRSYEQLVRLYLKPGLGKKRLNKLTAPDIRMWLN